MGSLSSAMQNLGLVQDCPRRHCQTVTMPHVCVVSDAAALASRPALVIRPSHIVVPLGVRRNFVQVFCAPFCLHRSLNSRYRADSGARNLVAKLGSNSDFHMSTALVRLCESVSMDARIFRHIPRNSERTSSPYWLSAACCSHFPKPFG
ncbi:hypothetical protein NCU16421 [Neurospora crassa OR74A]|uniref:Uncharacterized protein n=1 Tax=Neurospora crassa (strain ATCC 24698 / 74-OR23-1A / CBS 708.71 / DSM 1257 / FGSC 987) TaxID=367110 RepID=V5IPX8_NEUCR|nr:hypothetical protein NCU16421 [Neurospora crassa OR74A]ESA44218.1 hypothetical protein NCU16421 [Neurospora crassa OR74A]|eukprot:XP_011393401.1 hypothetical protein NCU16421 [Neurospora crassa OR74A]